MEKRDKNNQLEADAMTMKPEMRFINMRPGGNDTALVVGIPDSQEECLRVNKAMQVIYPNIEQVGFVSLDPMRPQLRMAGGEFCGNATRSSAWTVLGGQPGVIDIQVSGVSGTLRAGVIEDGEAFAQMPVYPEPDRVVPDDDIPGNMTVTMEGITHYLDFQVAKIKGLTPEDIKIMARAELARRGLDQEAAAGIMYAEQTANGWKITPIVYVRDVDTLYYETACGSGTTAMGLALAMQAGESIAEVPIIQPSGLPIKVSVDYDGKRFGYTQIQGPIEKLQEGSLEAGKVQPYAVEQITTPAQLKDALEQRGLREAYADAFGRPPYEEKFTTDEIDTMFGDYYRDGRVFTAVADGKIIAFSATQPLDSVPDPEVSELLVGCEGIDEKSWYIPELGIRREYEGTGVAKMLMRRAIDATPASAITLRTRADNLRAQRLYRSLGFDIVPELYQEKDHERINGEVESDIRIFMALKRTTEDSLDEEPTIESAPKLPIVVYQYRDKQRYE